MSARIRNTGMSLRMVFSPITKSWTREHVETKLLISERAVSSQRALVRAKHVVTETGEHHLVNGIVAAEEAADFADRDFRRRIDRIAVYAAADRRKCDGAHSVLDSEREALPVTRCEQFGLVLRSAAPHRPDRMNHEFRGQPVSTGDLRVARRTSAERPALDEELGAGGAVNGAVN